MKTSALLSLIFFLFACYSLIGQLETRFWYTGYEVGMDFSTSPPTPVYNGKTNSVESTSVMSDACGNLLFYTDGYQVWSSDHTIMQDGIGIGTGCFVELDVDYTSTTQGVMITPAPGQCDQYYIFTTGCAELGLTGGLRYSIVDMGENGGLGKVISKDNLLYEEATEKLNAVFHANGRDVWLISRKNQTNEFRVYLIDEDGLQTNPIISSVGQISDGVGQGGMQITPNGDRLVLMTFQRNPEFFFFNNQTGVLTEDFILPDPEIVGYYSAAFSPSGEKIYMSTVGWFNEGLYLVDQFDLTAGSPNEVFNSKINLIDNSFVGPNFPGGLQLALDGKIYSSGKYSDNGGLEVLNSVNAILNPELYGLACNFTLDYVEIDSAIIPGIPGLGFTFPNFVASYLATDYESPSIDIFSSFSVQITDSCLTEPILFFDESQSECEIRSWSWNFGDPQSGSSNISTLQNPEHQFSDPGTYLVSLVVDAACSMDTSFQEITFGPPFDYGNDPISDQLFCIGDEVNILWPGPEEVLWSTSEISNSIDLVNEGIYWAEITIDECTFRDSFLLTEIPYPGYELQDEYQWCRGSQFAIALPEDDNLYSLNGDMQADSFFIEQDGTYEVEISNGTCITEGQFSVSGEDCPICKLYIPNAFSPNDDGINDGFQSYSDCLPENFEMQVFDRWGGQLFETNDINEFWDGKKNGKTLGSGIYVYWIRATFYEERVPVPRIYKGDIALLQ